MPRRDDYETSIENRFCINIGNWARDRGILVCTLKLNIKGRRGFPDRLVLWEGHNLLFIEFKRPGEEPRKLQKYIHEFLRDMGFEVAVYDDSDIAFRDVQAKIRATAPTAKEHEAGRYGTRLSSLFETGPGEDGGSSEGVRHPEEKRSR